MSVLNSGPVGRLFAALWNGRHVRAAETVIRRDCEGALFATMLALYIVLWMLYDVVSNASVDTHFDLSEASVWAENFAFGYKHPPMTAWVFSLWFSVFPRADWAAHLLAVSTTAVTFVITWRLLRDYLDKERALVGIASLMLVPLYTFQAARLNANTVMMPFWAAALLFYLRARRNLGVFDAILAGAFASFAFLGKYWAIYLVAGMMISSFMGPGTRRFWHSPAPYLMALSAAVVVAPHIVWFLTERSHATEDFMASSVMTTDSSRVAIVRSISYLGGTLAYVVIPLIFFGALLPGRAVIADVLWPSDSDRQQAHLLFLIPLILPAFANLVFPHRLTPVWTFPNWALLPVVLFGSPLLAIPAAAVARAGLVALSVSVAAVVASPYVAYVRLRPSGESQEAHFRQVAAAVASFSGQPVRLIAGSKEIVQGLPFYLPQVRPVEVLSLSAEDRGDINARGLVIVCISNDMACRSGSAALAGASGRSTDVTFTRSFLGKSGPPASFRITAVAPVALRH